MKQSCIALALLALWTGVSSQAHAVTFTDTPTSMATAGLSESPTTSPTALPVGTLAGTATSSPTVLMTPNLSESPTTSPTALPVGTLAGTATGSPTVLMTPNLSESPTTSPTALPVGTLAGTATASPTAMPVGTLAGTATTSPTISATPNLSGSPTSSATVFMTPNLSGSPTFSPTPGGSGAIDLQSACNFAVLAGTGITNNGTTSIVGDVGSYPNPSQTGFGTVALTGTNHFGDSFTVAAKGHLDAAYNDGMGRVTTATLATGLGSTTVSPGVYESVSGNFGINGILTLDGAGDPNAVFIFKMATSLITSAGSSVVLVNGAQAKNVFWVVGSSATLGGVSDLKGSVLAYTSITLGAGASVTGRVLARNGLVSLDSNAVSNTIGCGSSGATPTVTATSGISILAFGTPGTPPPASNGSSYIYPSPARGERATIVCQMRESGEVTVKIHNQTGRLVDTITGSRGAGQQTFDVSVGKFSSGNYYYVVYLRNSANKVEAQVPRKFVVVH